MNNSNNKAEKLKMGVHFKLGIFKENINACRLLAVVKFDYLHLSNQMIYNHNLANSWELQILYF